MNKLRLLAGILFWGAGMTCLPSIYGAENPQSRQRGNSGQHRTTQSKSTATRSTVNKSSSAVSTVQQRPNNKGTRPGGNKGHGNNNGNYGGNKGHGNNGNYGHGNGGHGNGDGNYGHGNGGHGNGGGNYGHGNYGHGNGGHGNGGVNYGHGNGGHGNGGGNYGHGNGGHGHGGHGYGYDNHYYGNSVPPPGGHPNNYRPPMRPRWERPLPPPPPRYNYVRVGVPPIQAILGLTFGSLIDAGINTLINAGYTVSSAINNAIFLNNVSQFGIVWPEATIYYGGTGMSGARFQYGSYSPTDYRFRTVYIQLCSLYGDPISTTYTNGNPSCTWWGGNNTGYITLTYGPALNQSGATMYYTDLIYGM